MVTRHQRSRHSAAHQRMRLWEFEILPIFIPCRNDQCLTVLQILWLSVTYIIYITCWLIFCEFATLRMPTGPTRVCDCKVPVLVDVANIVEHRKPPTYPVRIRRVLLSGDLVRLYRFDVLHRGGTDPTQIALETAWVSMALDRELIIPAGTSPLAKTNCQTRWSRAERKL